jgi:PAS domain S-box-containing protein
MPASTLRYSASLVALAALYVLAGKLGLQFAFVHASATAVWPPTGIAIAAFLLFGPRVWPAVAVGAFLVNVTTAGSVATSLGIAAGNTAEGLLAAWLAERFANGRHAFARAQDIFVFALAVVPAVLVSATVGVTSLGLGGYAPWADFGPIWITWALGDLTGAFIVAPLLLLWAERRASPLLGHPLEAVGLLLSVLGVGQAVFGGWAPSGLERYPLAFLCIAPLVWAACRFGRRAAAIAVVLLSGIALHGTLRGLGPFAVVPPPHALLILQAFLATMALVTLVIAALVWVRERESALLQAIIDRIPVMITVYEPNTGALRLNREFERLTGWTTADARQADLMAQGYPGPAYQARLRAYTGELPEGWHEVEMATKDGRVLATSWTNVRLADDTRVGIGLDVREQRQAEAERERARVEAEAASQAKDEFFAMLGHELRNPLNAIAVWLHLVESTGSLDQKGREIIGRQVRHLARLVDDLLDVTRLATGKVALRWSPVDLGLTARRVVTTVAGGAADRHIRCHAPGDLWIRADETRLEQILMNLLDNAVKFTGADGRITVTVTADAGEAVLRVEDTGAGIPAELLPRIFDLFVQGRTGLHRRGAGLGVGLTLVKRLVDLHAGRIEVTSAGPGHGAVFTLRFPLIDPIRPAPSGEARPAPAGVSRRILVVEDDEDSRQMLRRLLELSGHRVAEAEDGLSGLEQTLALRPDVVLIDVGLPELDGYQVAGRIRAAGLTDVVLIAVTGYGQLEDRLRADAAGFDAHITKPVNPAALADLLTQRPA